MECVYIYVIIIHIIVHIVHTYVVIWLRSPLARPEEYSYFNGIIWERNSHAQSLWGEGGNGAVAAKWLWWGRNDRLRGLMEMFTLSSNIQWTGWTGDATFMDKGALKEARWTRETLFREKRMDSLCWLAIGDESQICYEFVSGTLLLNYLLSRNIRCKVEKAGVHFYWGPTTVYAAHVSLNAVYPSHTDEDTGESYRLRN